jgi:hypothetical protein
VGWERDMGKELPARLPPSPNSDTKIIHTIHEAALSPCNLDLCIYIGTFKMIVLVIEYKELEVGIDAHLMKRVNLRMDGSVSCAC